ncbi:MAG: MbnP family copper-binding protein [Cystobacter sp.]
MRLPSPRLLVLTSVCASSLACGIQEPEEKTTPVDIAFEARVGAQPFACGRTYTGLGTTATTYEPMDFRVYLHDVRLVTSGGEEVPVTLTEDGKWQKGGALLLDFADQSGLCGNGTAAMNTRLLGTVPEGAGPFQGLRFKLGLPESLNHQDVSVAPAPFNDIGLFWSWRAGYLFTRIEGRTAGLTAGHFMHLGSTDCPPLVPGQTSSGCTFPNTPEVGLEGFTPGVSRVVMDLASLFVHSNLDADSGVPNTAIGCMASQNDPDCAPVFKQLGLAFGGEPGDPRAQTFIRLE